MGWSLLEDKSAYKICVALVAGTLLGKFWKWTLQTGPNSKTVQGILNVVQVLPHWPEVKTNV